VKKKKYVQLEITFPEGTLRAAPPAAGGDGGDVSYDCGCEYCYLQWSYGAFFEIKKRQKCRYCWLWPDMYLVCKDVKCCAADRRDMLRTYRRHVAYRQATTIN
jgi:hypothetical protein